MDTRAARCLAGPELWHLAFLWPAACAAKPAVAQAAGGWTGAFFAAGGAVSIAARQIGAARGGRSCGARRAELESAHRRPGQRHPAQLFAQPGSVAGTGGTG